MRRKFTAISQVPFPGDFRFPEGTKVAVLSGKALGVVGAHLCAINGLAKMLDAQYCEDDEHITGILGEVVYMGELLSAAHYSYYHPVVHDIYEASRKGASFIVTTHSRELLEVFAEEYFKEEFAYARVEGVSGALKYELYTRREFVASFLHGMEVR